MSYSVIDIANKIVNNADLEQGEIISNLKLQKLLYYVQGFFIAVFDKKLFEDDLQAWQYGPVVKDAYYHFKEFGSGAIILSEDVKQNIVSLKEDETELFYDVLNEYGQFSAIKLMNMTHEESPWKLTFNQNPQGVIPYEYLKEYFTTQLA